MFRALFLTFAVTPALAAVRSVSATGADSGDCVATPCLTLEYALSQCGNAVGDEISLGVGNYRCVRNYCSTLTTVSSPTHASPTHILSSNSILMCGWQRGTS